MVEEIFNLSKRISDQANYIKRQKIYASNLRLQNRRLEKNVDSLEMLGAKGPRTGAPTQLRAILQGLRLKAGSLEAVCDSQEEEIFQLQRDLRVTNTRETQIERDVYSGEIGRLQRAVKQLKKSHIRLSTENKELSRMREEILYWFWQAVAMIWFAWLLHEFEVVFADFQRETLEGTSCCTSLRSFLLN